MPEDDIPRGRHGMGGVDVGTGGDEPAGARDGGSLSEQQAGAEVNESDLKEGQRRRSGQDVKS